MSKQHEGNEQQKLGLFVRRIYSMWAKAKTREGPSNVRNIDSPQTLKSEDSSNFFTIISEVSHINH